MSVKVRPYKRGGWEVDIQVRQADGSQLRERRRSPLTSRSAALRWGEARERELTLHGPRKPKKEVPTLTEFVPRFLDGYARANRQKPSGIAAKETALRIHLVPALGSKPLDAINNEDVQRLKADLSQKAPKTVNNFVGLARQGYYDGLTFHRVVPEFVIQGGCPEGTGRGGPGYSFGDEPVQGTYVEGAVAMANAGPDTNGSQFFICIDDCTQLPPQYNLFGHVTEGMDVAKATQVGDVMKSITVRERPAG